MNKVYQYISDYRLPTEKPLEEAVRLYGWRVLIICAVAVSAMVASVLIALIVTAFHAGYGLIIIIAVGWLLYSFINGGTSGGTSNGGQSPPPTTTTETKIQVQVNQTVKDDTRELITVDARRGQQKQKTRRYE
jgi:apolipoprotein N-acyltransferase